MSSPRYYETPVTVPYDVVAASTWPFDPDDEELTFDTDDAGVDPDFDDF
jgi:hypothetical protein